MVVSWLTLGLPIAQLCLARMPPDMQPLTLVDEHREPAVHDAIGLAILFVRKPLV